MRARGAALALALTAAAACLAAPGCEKRDKSLYEEAERLWLNDRYDAAISKLRLLVDEFPESKIAPQALFRIGEIYYLSLDEPAKGLEYLERAAGEAGDEALALPARRYMAEIYEKSIRDYDLAIEQYHKIINEGGPDVEEDEYHYRIARAYFKKGDYSQAAIEYKTLLERFPESGRKEDAWYQIATLMILLEKPEEALEIFRKLLTDGPSPEREYDIRMGIGACYEEMGKLDEALGEYHKARELYPDRELIARKIDAVNKRKEKKLGR